MLKVLNPTLHGVLDYALAIAFLLAPGIFGFSGTAATLSYIIGIAYLATSILTQYPLGVLKLIPFPVHGWLEGLMAAAWIIFPWLFGFAADAAARNFYVIAGIGLLAVVALTDYTSVGERAFARGHERRLRTEDRRQRSMPVARNRRMALADRRSRLAAT